MPSLAVWTFLAFALMQGYVAAWLLSRRSGAVTLPRFFLGLLLLFNAVVAVLFLFDRLGSGLFFPFLLFDAPTNGLLVLSAEAIRGAVLRRPVRFFAWPFAGAVSAAPIVLELLVVDLVPEVPPVFTLLGYSYAAIVLAETALRADPAAPEARWMPWVLAAFSPRIAEFLVGFGWLPGGASSWAAPLQGLALLGMAIGLAGVVVFLTRPRGRSLALPTGFLLALGLTFGYLRMTNAFAVGEPVVIQLTLGAVRPIVFLTGIGLVGLLGVRAPPRVLLHDSVVMGGSAATAGVAFLLVPSLLERAAPQVVIPIAGILAIASIPVWSWSAMRLGRRPPVSSVEPMTEPLDGSTAARPGLDAACKFDAAALARYDEAALQVRSLSRGQRAALAALNRGQRVLLALEGSSSGSIGAFEFSHAGLQLATHIPYKHIRGVVHALNQGREGNAALIASTTGVRGTRYYWLTERGHEEAARLARRVGFVGEHNPRWVGEAFSKEAGPTAAMPFPARVERTT